MYWLTGIGPAAPIRLDDAGFQPGHTGWGCVTGFAVAIAQTPASTIGSDSTMPMVSQPKAEEIAELLIGLAEEFDDDARETVAANEGAADEARRL